MNSTRPFVVFKHENEDFVLQNEQIVLNRYYREFFGETIINFQTKSNHKFVKQFFTFLQTGKVPTVFEDQVEVFELLKEWDCHDLVFDSYRFRIQSGTNNYYISHQSVLYPVNIGCFYFHSSAFQDFCHCNSHELFNIELKCSAKTIEVFLDLLHFRIRQPELGDVDEVLELSRFLGCSSLCALINERSEMKAFNNYIKKENNEKAEDQQKIEYLMKRLTELEKYKQENDWRKKEEEENRLRGEQKKREEEERKKKGEEQRNREEQERMKNEEEERKQKEEFERIGKWKSTKAPDFEGNIFEAAAKGKLTSIIYLLANGTNVNAFFSNGYYDGEDMTDCTPLHFSSRYGHLSVVEYLVNQNAYINVQDKDDATPLHHAVINGHLSVVEYLVNQKADINAKARMVEFLYFNGLLFILRVEN